MGHKSTEKYNDICSLKHHMLHYVMGETEKGFEPNPEKVHVLKEYIEMIKCLAETEKECQEADYYEAVVQAMEETGMMESERMGYNPNRNRMGQYSDGRARNRNGDRMSSDSGNSDSGSNSRRGYSPDRVYSRMMPGDDRDEWGDDDPRHSEAFNRFRKAKRYYTKSHSDEDKQRMKDASNEHMMETMATIREMWDDADPDLRARMKTDLTNLVANLK